MTRLVTYLDFEQPEVLPDHPGTFVSLLPVVCGENCVRWKTETTE